MPRTRHRRLLALVMLCVLLPIAAATSLIVPAQRPATAGSPLANLAARLDPADPRRGQPIRVLFYGQSITRQDWWQGAAAHLLRRFPGERFEFRNLAIGGHDAQRLARLVDADVLPYQPDLVILHAYGDPAALDETVRRIRTGTVADVLIATDHLVSDDERDEETRSWLLLESGMLRRAGTTLGLLPAGTTWTAWRNHEFLPDLAARYGLGLIDVRAGWRRALAESGARASDFLSDDIHLNARGVRLMERLVVADLDRLIDQDLVSPRAGRASAPTAPRVRTVPSDCARPASVSGYRVDVTPTAVGSAAPAPADLDARLDGARLDSLAALHWVERASPLPGTDYPALLRVQLTGPRVTVGRYAVRLLAREADGAYRVALHPPGGGEPVVGRTDQPLLLARHGVRIDPLDWNLGYAESAHGIADFTGHTATFRVNGPGASRSTSAPATASGAAEAPAVLFRASRNAERAVCVPGLSDPAARLVEYRAPLSCPFGWRWACRLDAGA